VRVVSPLQLLSSYSTPKLASLRYAKSKDIIGDTEIICDLVYGAISHLICIDVT
jgi:hypothetical protein